MSNNSQITFENVSKTYKTDIRQKRSTALDKLSLSVEKGEVFGIIGPNGAGKSTALKILMGFVRSDAGMVTLAGRPTNDPFTHQNVGYLPENPCLYDNLTVTEHLRFATRISAFSGKDATDRIAQVLALVDLKHAADLAIRHYSKGMVQRAALAFALIHDPEILILDEPMSGLDPLGRQLVVDIIRDCNAKGTTILFSSHILTDVERICDRIGIMNKGRLLATTTPAALREAGGKASSLPGSKSPLESFFLQTITSDSTK